MKKIKYKSSVMITVILILNLTGFVCAGMSSSDANEMSSVRNFPLLTNTEKETDPFDSHYGSEIYRIIVALLIVTVLGIGAVYASKKLLPKWSAAQGKKIKVIESIHLGTRKTVHLLEIGNQQILIGTTHDRITKLADIFSEKGFPLSQTDKNEDVE